MMRIVAAVLLIALAAPAWAGYYWEGFAAYERGDYATALREWQPLAERGNAIAQHNIGVIYRRGEGVPQDSAQAARWYRKSAMQGKLAASRANINDERKMAATNRDNVARYMTPAAIAEAQRLTRAWRRNFT